MRLFVAMTPPEEVIESLTGHLAPRAEAPEGPRWGHPDQWHITLAFMAEVEEWRVDPLVEGLAEIARRHPPLTLRLQGAGAFPGPEAARVLWIGVEDTSDRLPRLARSVRGVCNNAGARPAGRRFSPHLTVARFRRPTEATRWIRALETLDAPRWAAGSMTLVESHLAGGPGGRPRHEVVQTFPLREG